ncbi:hypothetical protein GCM10009801_48830 [Streptomyces albiaxialis]|uniref:Tyr recombinase domain-containing protein n=1 Tax=Streptomyces albiaxialis TaxID=329523 RepID=A0ABN2W8Q9_9ACTN
MQYESRVRNHIIEPLGALRLRQIKPSTVQPWIKRRRQVLDETTVGRGRKWEKCRDKMMHALRHLFASEAINEGVDVHTLADLLGHEDPAFTLRRYVHRVTGAVAEAGKAIGKRYRLAAWRLADSLAGCGEERIARIVRLRLGAVMEPVRYRPRTPMPDPPR